MDQQGSVISDTGSPGASMPESGEVPSSPESIDTAPPKGSFTSVVFLWALGLAICIMAATILSMQNWVQPAPAPAPAPASADAPANVIVVRANAAGADGLANGGYFVIVCLYALAGVAAFSDAALRMIPNRFTYGALILSLCLTLVIAPACELLEWTDALLWIGANRSDWGGVALESLKGFGLCFVVGVVSFSARGLGGGDVKLLMAMGALAGFSLTVSILLNTLAVAAVVGVVNLLLQGKLIRSVQRVFLAMYITMVTRNCDDPKIFGRTESPFCLSLLIAMILLPFVNVHTVLSAGLSSFMGT